LSEKLSKAMSQRLSEATLSRTHEARPQRKCNQCQGQTHYERHWVCKIPVNPDALHGWEYGTSVGPRLRLNELNGLGQNEKGLVAASDTNLRVSCDLSIFSMATSDASQ
jgi:hypothetical protein